MNYLFQKSILYIIIGHFLLAFSVCAFNLPFQIAVGGSTGLSIIFNSLFSFDLSMFVLMINIICLSLGLFFVGKQLVMGSVLSSFLYPLFLSLCQNIPGITLLSHDIILSAIIGGVISGLGVGMVIKAGATIDGLEILSVIINKKTDISISQSMYIIDTVIMLGQLPFGQFDKVFYGIISAYLLTNMMHKVLVYGTNKEQVFVIIKQYELLKEELIKNDFGVTMFYATSGLKKTEFQVVNTTVFSKEITKIKTIIEKVDHTAFVTIHPVSEVRGRGFTLEKQIEYDSILK